MDGELTADGNASNSVLGRDGEIHALQTSSPIRPGLDNETPQVSILVKTTHSWFLNKHTNELP